MPDATRIKELRSAYEAKAQIIKDGAAKAIKIEGSNVEMKSEDFKTVQDAMKDAAEIKQAIRAEMFDVESKAFLDSLDAPVGGGSTAVAAAAAAQAFGAEAKSLGEMFTASDEFKKMVTSGRKTMDSPFMVERKDVASMGTYGQKDIYTGSVAPLSTLGFGRRQQDPMVPRAQRVNRVRDLFPVAGTNANLIDFFRVVGFAENNGAGNAGTVPERDGTAFGLKPKSNLEFEAAQAPVRTIAHWEAAHRNVLSDEPQLQATINNELLYGLALEEDEQILNGDGTGENLLGILNTPNVQVYSQVATDQKSDALRRAATLAVIANYPPTGYVLHPYDWEDVELQKAAAGGDGQYMLVTNFTNGLSTTIWRQPVVETPAMPNGTFLTGAFGIGAQLYDRMSANIRIAEQHQDFFVRNAVAILAEERIALAVKRPESFVVGTFLAD